MIRSLNTAQTAMNLEQVRIEALANNLANVNTAGFRQVLTRVAETGAAGVNDASADSLTQPSGPKRVNAGGDDVWVDQPGLSMFHAVDTRTGPIEATGRATDLALMGPGFFVVQDDEGERYTRDGSFRIDAAKQLTTSDGRVVLGEGGPINLDGEFSIEADGSVILDGAVIDRIRVVDFADPSRLEHLGESLLKASEDMATVRVGPEEVVVAQGHLEGSNVEPIDTLVAMIAAQRAFEVQSRVLTTEDEMLNKAVNNLPRVGS